MTVENRREAWLFMAREAEMIGAFSFADACLDMYWAECYRAGIASALRTGNN